MIDIDYKLHTTSAAIALLPSAIENWEADSAFMFVRCVSTLSAEFPFGVCSCCTSACIVLVCGTRPHGY